MAVTFTPQQQNAIDSRGGALIVSAAAGSGKTAVLVERVIRRITDPQDPVDIDGLLIVTFTNAAAAEMRERIADRLLAQLAEEPGSRRLRRQLALLGGARIQTVHAFCLDLVRQNFTQCGVNPGFRLLDTAESQLLKEQAMEEMLEEQYTDQDPDFLAALDNFAEERGDRKLQQVVMELYEGLRSHVNPAGVAGAGHPDGGIRRPQPAGGAGVVPRPAPVCGRTDGLFGGPAAGRLPAAGGSA